MSWRRWPAARPNVCRQVWFYTGDKDFLQLLDARTGQLKPGRRGDEVSEITPDTVRRDFGLEPRQLIDVFALSGDASDNIPGAPGIGEKTALQLIQRFGGLDELYACLEDASAHPAPAPDPGRAPGAGLSVA